MGKVSINESIWFHKIYAGSRDSRFAQPARLMCKGKLQLFDLILLSLKRCTYMKIPYPLRLSWFPQADTSLRSTAWSNPSQATKSDQQATTQTPLSGQTQAAGQPVRVLHQWWKQQEKPNLIKSLERNNLNGFLCFGWKCNTSSVALKRNKNVLTCLIIEINIIPVICFYLILKKCIILGNLCPIFLWETAFTHWTPVLT